MDSSDTRRFVSLFKSEHESNCEPGRFAGTVGSLERQIQSEQ